MTRITRITRITRLQGLYPFFNKTFNDLLKDFKNKFPIFKDSNQRLESIFF